MSNEIGLLIKGRSTKEVQDWAAVFLNLSDH